MRLILLHPAQFGVIHSCRSILPTAYSYCHQAWNPYLKSYRNDKTTQ